MDPAPAPLDPIDPALEALLRAAAPELEVQWRHDTERRLLAHHGRSTGRWGVLAAATGGLAVVLAGVTLAGGGPLASSGGDAARAKPGCTTVYVTRAEPLGQVRRQADGSVKVETVRQPVTSAVERCR
jgi:hypothetical protein